MTKTGAQRVQKGSAYGSQNVVSFKYYIHDTTRGYAMEMIGPFGHSAVPELACCWQTAKTTLKNRELTLDLRGVTSVDDVAQQWLASMAQEGAKYLPESFLLDAVAGLPEPQEAEASLRALAAKLSSAFCAVFALKQER